MPLKRIIKPLDDLKCIYSTLLCFYEDNSFCCITINCKQFSQFNIGCTKGKIKATMYIAACIKFENKNRTDQREDNGL